MTIRQTKTGHEVIVTHGKQRFHIGIFEAPEGAQAAEKSFKQYLSTKNKKGGENE